MNLTKEGEKLLKLFRKKQSERGETGCECVGCKLDMIHALKKSKEIEEKTLSDMIDDCSDRPKIVVELVKQFIKYVKEDCIGVPEQIVTLEKRYDHESLKVGFEAGVKFSLDHLNKRAGKRLI